MNPEKKHKQIPMIKEWKTMLSLCQSKEEYQLWKHFFKEGSIAYYHAKQILLKQKSDRIGEESRSEPK